MWKNVTRKNCAKLLIAKFAKDFNSTKKIRKTEKTKARKKNVQNENKKFAKHLKNTPKRK